MPHSIPSATTSPSTPPVALITGASRGIGAAIATVFAQAGYELYLTCKNSSMNWNYYQTLSNNNFTSPAMLS